MKINNLLQIKFLLILFVLFSCESLEDTYKDYSGDGKIKYIGKCKSFSVQTGWKRFVFNWERSPDSNSKEVQISWRNDNQSGVYTIPIDNGSFETEANFKDAPYIFECRSVGFDGSMSSPILQYARPYTFNHQLIAGFPKVVNKYAFIQNNTDGHDLVLFLDEFKDEIKKATLTYYSNNNKEEMVITKDLFDKKYIVIDNVQIDKSVTVDRIAKVEGCIDEVVFDTFSLDPMDKVLNYDFNDQLMREHNLTEITPTFINDLEVLNMNFSLKSLEDILYFPNLKKIVLGGNRYTTQTTPADIKKMILSNLDDKEKSVFALTLANKLGVEIVIHNDHYGIRDNLPFAIKKENPTLPKLEYLDTKEWTIKSSTKEGTTDIDAAQPENIFDNNSATLWHPQNVQNYIRIHKLDIDMKSVRTMNGFKITQAAANNYVVREYYPNIMRIQISNDEVIWEDVFYQAQSIIGQNYGESTILYTPEAKNARYIRLIINDQVHAAYGRSNSCLGDFMIF